MEAEDKVGRAMEAMEEGEAGRLMEEGEIITYIPQRFKDEGEIITYIPRRLISTSS